MNGHPGDLGRRVAYQRRKLGLTVDTLLGSAADRPPSGRAHSEPRFTRLDAGECMRLLAPGGVGRLVFTTEQGPEAVPVNFAVYEGAVVFRTKPGTVLATQLGKTVGFEVDRLDEAMSRGWSVLVSGVARQVVNPADVARIRAVVEPWAGDDRRLYVVVDPDRISGRRIDS